MVTVRGTTKTYVNNAGSGSIAIPSGSAAGDPMLIFAGHGYGVSTPVGWSAVNASPGSFYNGAVLYKILTSGDITTGSVTVSFAGSYYGTLMAISFVGGTTYFRTVAAQRNSSGATSRTTTTDATPGAGDLAVHFAAGRASNTVTISQGTQQQTSTQTESSGVLNTEVRGSGGAVTSNASFSTTPSGDYEAVAVMSGTGPPAGGLATQWRLYVTATQGGATNPGIAELEFRATNGGADQTTVGTYTQSSQYSGSYPGSAAFDNSSGTFWLANTTPTAWVGFEAPYAINIAEITMMPRQDDLTQAPSAFNLQYFDGSTWQTAKSWTTGTWSAGQTRTFVVATTGDGAASMSMSAAAVSGPTTTDTAGAAAMVMAATGAGTAIKPAAGAAAVTATATGVGAATKATAGAAAVVVAATGVGGATATGAGSAAGAFSAAGVGGALVATDGAAGAVLAAAGIGASIAAGAGAAAITSSASGAGATETILAGAGAASISISATGTGSSEAASVGLASVTLSAGAIGGAIAEAVGTSEGALTATGAGSALVAAAGIGGYLLTASAVGEQLELGIVGRRGFATIHISAAGVGAALGPRIGRPAVVRRVANVEAQPPRVRSALVVSNQAAATYCGDRIVEAPRAA